MPLTQGNVTIKLAGGDYSTWAAFWDDIGNLTGDITCTVDASAFTEATAPASVTENLNGYTLHVLPAAFPTTTDASTGARITANYIGRMLDLQVEGAGDVIIEGMVLIQGTSRPLRCIDFWNIETEFNVTIRRNIIKGCFRGVSIYDSTMNVGVKVYNNICFDQEGDGFFVGSSMGSSLWANNTTVRSLQDGFDVQSQVITLANNLAYGADYTDYVSISANATGNNNADSDNTGEDADWGGGGSNNVSGISDPFNNIGADDFTITAEGVIGTAGLDLSGDFTDDFFGVTRINWTIGACEFEGVGVEIDINLTCASNVVLTGANALEVLKNLTCASNVVLTGSVLLIVIEIDINLTCASNVVLTGANALEVLKNLTCASNVVLTGNCYIILTGETELHGVILT